jgi:hypothetical protein
MYAAMFLERVLDMSAFLRVVGAGIVSFTLHAQPATHFSERASLVVQANGTILVNANSPRPIHQSITALAQAYSTVMDYEDPVYEENQVFIDEGNKQLLGGVFKAVLPPITDRNSELSAIQSLLRQYGKARDIPFKLETHSSDERLDIVGQSPATVPALLDTKIVLRKKPRTVSQAVDGILSAIQQRRGTTITRGGFLDSGMDIQVDIDGSSEKPARELLAQALDACTLARVWVLAYEPTDGKFYLGIQNALGSNDGHLLPLRQTHPQIKK